MALEFIKESWGDRFPGPQPVSIESRHFPLLKKQPYFLCEKTDGVRHLLVSIADGVFLINRALVQTPVRGVRIPKETLLDGDLVESKNGKFIFVIHDAVRVKGEDIRLGPLDARLDKARGLVKGIIKTAGAPFEIRVKTMIRLEQAREFPSLESFDYETDGVVLTPVKEPIRTGTHETMFKWKPRDRITIDFELRMGNELYIQERGKPIRMAEMHLGNKRPDLATGAIVECGYGDLGWFVEKVRTDKAHPNNLRTYERTIVNLQEAIKLPELIEAVCK